MHSSWGVEKNWSRRMDTRFERYTLLHNINDGSHDDDDEGFDSTQFASVDTEALAPNNPHDVDVRLVRQVFILLAK